MKEAVLTGHFTQLLQAITEQGNSVVRKEPLAGGGTGIYVEKPLRKSSVFDLAFSLGISHKIGFYEMPPGIEIGIKDRENGSFIETANPRSIETFLSPNLRPFLEMELRLRNKVTHAGDSGWSKVPFSISLKDYLHVEEAKKIMDPDKVEYVLKPSEPWCGEMRSYRCLDTNQMIFGKANN